MDDLRSYPASFHTWPGIGPRLRAATQRSRVLRLQAEAPARHPLRMCLLVLYRALYLLLRRP